MMKSHSNHTFFLNVAPPEVTAQSSKRLSHRYGHSCLFETKEGRAVKDMYRSALLSKKPKIPLSGAIVARYIFFYPYKKTVPSRKLQKAQAIVPRITKPDWDNLPKHLQDIMTELGFWDDDNIIFDGGLLKFFAPFSGIYVDIYSLPCDKDYTENLKDILQWCREQNK